MKPFIASRQFFAGLDQHPEMTLAKTVEEILRALPVTDEREVAPAEGDEAWNEAVEELEAWDNYADEDLPPFARLAAVKAIVEAPKDQ